MIINSIDIYHVEDKILMSSHKFENQYNVVVSDIPKEGKTIVAIALRILLGNSTKRFTNISGINFHQDIKIKGKITLDKEYDVYISKSKYTVTSSDGKIEFGGATSYSREFLMPKIGMKTVMRGKKKTPRMDYPSPLAILNKFSIIQTGDNSVREMLTINPTTNDHYDKISKEYLLTPLMDEYCRLCNELESINLLSVEIKKTKRLKKVNTDITTAANELVGIDISKEDSEMYNKSIKMRNKLSDYNNSIRNNKSKTYRNKIKIKELKSKIEGNNNFIKELQDRDVNIVHDGYEIKIKLIEILNQLNSTPIVSLHDSNNLNELEILTKKLKIEEKLITQKLNKLNEELSDLEDGIDSDVFKAMNTKSIRKIIGIKDNSIFTKKINELNQTVKKINKKYDDFVNDRESYRSKLFMQSVSNFNKKYSYSIKGHDASSGSSYSEKSLLSIINVCSNTDIVYPVIIDGTGDIQKNYKIQEDLIMEINSGDIKRQVIMFTVKNDDMEKIIRDNNINEIKLDSAGEEKLFNREVDSLPEELK